MTTQVNQAGLVGSLQVLQDWLLIAYAISLPLSMTASWGLLTAGMIVWAVEALVRRAMPVTSGGGTVVADVPDVTLNKIPIREVLHTVYPLTLPLALVVLAVAISGAFNHAEHHGFGQAFKDVWSLKGIAIYFWASKVFHSRPFSAIFAFQLLFCVSATAGIWGAIQQVFDYHPFTYKWLQGTGFLSNPMAFAGQMQILALLALGVFLKRGYDRFEAPLSAKFVFAFIVLANLAGLYFAGEKSGWLGGLIGILVISAMTSWKTLLKAVYVITVVSVISFCTVPLVKTRITTMFTGMKDVSSGARVQMWNKSVELWKDSPLIGIGVMNFPRISNPEATEHGQNKDLTHAHSNYLQFLATTGVLGGLAFLYLCFTMIWQARKAALKADQSGDELGAGFNVGLLGAMVSLMVAGLFEFNFGTAQVRLVQWFVLGLLAFRTETPVATALEEILSKITFKQADN